MINWAIQPLESPNPNSTAHSPGFPLGSPSQEQIALPGDFRVGSGAGISVNNRTTITQGRWTEGSGRFWAEIVSPAKQDTIMHGAGISDMSRTAITKGLPTDGNGRFLAEIASPAIIPVSIQTIDLDDTVRSSPFTRTERQTRTYNMRGTALTAKDSVFLGDTDAGSTVPAKNVPHTQALGAPLQRGQPPRSTPMLARLRWLAVHMCLDNPYIHIVIPSWVGCLFQRPHGGGACRAPISITGSHHNGVQKWSTQAPNTVSERCAWSCVCGPCSQTWIPDSSVQR